MSNLDKKALAQPLSPEIAKEWAGKGMFQSPNITEEMPKGHTKGEYGKILEESGADNLFGADLPKLRKFYMPDVKSIVVIDTKEYLLTHIEKSREQGRGKEKTHVDGYIEAFGPIIRKPNKAIDWKQTPTQPVQFSYDQYENQIKRSPEVIKEKLDIINEFIADQNSFIDKQTDKKFGTVTTLPLQIARAKDAIDKRLKQLEDIQKNVDKSVDKKEKKTDRATKDLTSLREEVMTGKTPASPANYAVSVLETKFHSIPTLQELKSDLVNLKPPFDPQVSAVIKSYLEKVVDWQIKKREDEIAKKGLDKSDRSERNEADLPEMRELLLKKIKPVDESSLRGKYDKAQGYYSPEGIGGQATRIEESTSTDYDELVKVKNSLDGALQTIVDLPRASNEYLMANNGAKLNEIQAFIDNTTLFIKRYKKPVYVPSETEPDMMEINPLLFGNSPEGLGNALLAVVLNQVILSVNGELSRIRGGQPVAQPIIPQHETTPVPTETKVPVTSKKKDKKFIEKLSSALWQAFEHRFKGKINENY